ncbi:hypothetical protein [uncultured Fibrobacter sp.]|uniref:hypothetical protein n=2 Tax=Fibrobacter TaxID=832 RepID=UPI0025CF02FC|nr:hypothetical protein [uncultured Fibrobacter sp.]MDY5723312.1 hypothetical protein [Fibrobacter sp.]
MMLSRQTVERGSIKLAIRRRTALSLYCAVDSVIPDALGWPLDADFLKKMKLWWFETSGVPLD